MTKPVIGLTLDWKSEGGYSKYSWYAIRENYCAAIHEAGGVPLLLPFYNDDIDQYLDQVDGLVITGGGVDLNPALYGETVRHESVKIIEKRSSFEWKLAQRALEQDMPILGICGGHQLLNVILGGSLVQDIPTEWKQPLEHRQMNPYNEPGHDLSVHGNTLLHDIVQNFEICVNSDHHQAIREIGPEVVINSIAPDGIIEGIEAPKHRFCLGVQWHPEFTVTNFDRKIFKHFVHISS